MPAPGNKALIRRFYEQVWDKGNLDVCDESAPRTTCATISGPV
jgi:hypothetical protein